VFHRIPCEYHISDLGTSLGVVDFSKIPFLPKRIYWISDMTIQEPRGFHAHKRLNQVLVVQEGRIKLDLFQGSKKESFIISNNDSHIYIPSGCWREIYPLEERSSILVLADQIYDESDYIRTWDEYVMWFIGNEGHSEG
jgi:WxcM-like, C-terminal